MSDHDFDHEPVETPAPVPSPAPARPLASTWAASAASRHPKRLYVYANPWHAPLDHNHRANAAVPWDPDNHNPDGGLVGATRVLDAQGEMYFEFAQFDHDLELHPDAAPIELPEFGAAGRSTHYLQAIKDGALLPADPVTHAKAWGSDVHFVDPVQRLAWEKAGRLAQHERDHGEVPSPKPRLAKGSALTGMSHAPTAMAAVSPVPAGQSAKDAAVAAIADLRAASAAQGRT